MVCLVDSPTVSQHCIGRDTLRRSLQHACLYSLFLTLSTCSPAEEQIQEVRILDAVKSIKLNAAKVSTDGVNRRLLSRLMRPATEQLAHLQGHVLELTTRVLVSRGAEQVSQLREKSIAKIDKNGHWHVSLTSEFSEQEEDIEVRSRHCMGVNSQRYFSSDGVDWHRYESADNERFSCLDKALSWIPNLLSSTQSHLELSVMQSHAETDLIHLGIEGFQLNSINPAQAEKRIGQWNKPESPYFSLLAERGVLQRLTGRVKAYGSSGAVTEGKIVAEFEIRKASKAMMNIEMTVVNKALSELIAMPQHTIVRPRQRVISDVAAITGLDPKKLGPTAPLRPQPKAPKMGTKTRD